MKKITEIKNSIRKQKIICSWQHACLYAKLCEVAAIKSQLIFSPQLSSHYTDQNTEEIFCNNFTEINKSNDFTNKEIRNEQFTKN